MDKCCFRAEKNGVFIKCNALKVGHCPEKCKFRKTEDEYKIGIENAALRLSKKGLQPCITTNAKGENIMSVEKVVN